MKKKFLLLVAPLLLIFACCHTQRDKKSDEYVEEKIIPEKTDVQEIEKVLEERIEIDDQTEDSKSGEIESATEISETESAEPKNRYKEVWGYVMTDREHFFSPQLPVTDLCYFAADISSYAEITTIPNPKRFADFNGRIHLVVFCGGMALTHFSMEPGSEARKRLMETMEAASKKYDGIQIDFENVGARDAGIFQNFLIELRKRIGPEKMLSVALPARTRKLKGEIYDYEKIAPLVDRIIIMAYDEHWPGGKAGPVASMGWCGNVADYCKQKIPNEKLVMGLPFYGRAWENEGFDSSWIYKSIERIKEENGVTEIKRVDSVPYFEFDKEIHVTAYYDDAQSLSARCSLYSEKGIEKVAFWRIGQEDTSFWKEIGLKN